MAQNTKFPFGLFAFSILTAIALGLAIAEIRADPKNPLGLMGIQTAWYIFYVGIFAFVFNSFWFSRIAKKARIAKIGACPTSTIDKIKPTLADGLISQKEAIPDNVALRWVWRGALSAVFTSIVFWNTPHINQFYSYGVPLISCPILLLVFIYRKLIGAGLNEPVIRKKDIKIYTVFASTFIFIVGHILGFVVIALIKLIAIEFVRRRLSNSQGFHI